MKKMLSKIFKTSEKEDLNKGLDLNESYDSETFEVTELGSRRQPEAQELKIIRSKINAILYPEAEELANSDNSSALDVFEEIIQLEKISNAADASDYQLTNTDDLVDNTFVENAPEESGSMLDAFSEYENPVDNPIEEQSVYDDDFLEVEDHTKEDEEEEDTAETAPEESANDVILDENTLEDKTDSNEIVPNENELVEANIGEELISENDRTEETSESVNEVPVTNKSSESIDDLTTENDTEETNEEIENSVEEEIVSEELEDEEIIIEETIYEDNEDDFGLDDFLEVEDQTTEFDEDILDETEEIASNENSDIRIEDTTELSSDEDDFLAVSEEIADDTDDVVSDVSENETVNDEVLEVNENADMSPLQKQVENDVDDINKSYMEKRKLFIEKSSDSLTTFFQIIDNSLAEYNHDEFMSLTNKLSSEAEQLSMKYLVNYFEQINASILFFNQNKIKAADVLPFCKKEVLLSDEDDLLAKINEIAAFNRSIKKKKSEVVRKSSADFETDKSMIDKTVVKKIDRSKRKVIKKTRQNA